MGRLVRVNYKSLASGLKTLGISHPHLAADDPGCCGEVGFGVKRESKGGEVTFVFVERLAAGELSR